MIVPTTKMNLPLRNESFSVWIAASDASAQLIADLLVALSELQRAHGGNGFTWKRTGASLDLPDGSRVYEFVATEVL